MRGGVELEMPSMDLGVLTPESIASRESLHTDTEPPLVRRRRKGKEEESLSASSVVKKSDEVDNEGGWYYYIPALLVVGVVGALSFSSWSRRHHGS
jgi:thiamine pyrophosphokinase